MDDKRWSKNKLQEFINGLITKMMEGTLDFVEVSVGNQERYKILRSKILRLGNDTLRGISAELEKNYEVTYLGIGRDIVKVSTSGRNKVMERKGKNG